VRSHDQGTLARGNGLWNRLIESCSMGPIKTNDRVVFAADPARSPLPRCTG